MGYYGTSPATPGRQYAQVGKRRRDPAGSNEAHRVCAPQR